MIDLYWAGIVFVGLCVAVAFVWLWGRRVEKNAEIYMFRRYKHEHLETRGDYVECTFDNCSFKVVGPTVFRNCKFSTDRADFPLLDEYSEHEVTFHSCTINRAGQTVV